MERTPIFDMWPLCKVRFTCARFGNYQEIQKCGSLINSATVEPLLLYLAGCSRKTLCKFSAPHPNPSGKSTEELGVQASYLYRVPVVLHSYATPPLLKMDFSRFPSVAPMPFPVMCCAFVP